MLKISNHHHIVALNKTNIEKNQSLSTRLVSDSRITRQFKRVRCTCVLSTYLTNNFVHDFIIISLEPVHIDFITCELAWVSRNRHILYSYLQSIRLGWIWLDWIGFERNLFYVLFCPNTQADQNSIHFLFITKSIVMMIDKAWKAVCQNSFIAQRCLTHCP